MVEQKNEHDVERGKIMIDKKRALEEAKEYCADGCGYILSVMKDGKAPELCIAGDMLALMWQTVALVERIAYKTSHSFDETFMAILSMKSVGYEEVNSKFKDAEIKYVEGEDWQEKWKEETKKKIKQEANIDNITLALNLAELEKRNTSLNNQLVDLKKDYSNKLKAKDDQIKALTKECMALEHRMKEMEEHTILPEDDEK